MLIFSTTLCNHSHPAIHTSDFIVAARRRKASDEEFERSAVNVSPTERNTRRTLTNGTSTVVGAGVEADGVAVVGETVVVVVSISVQTYFILVDT